jgi:hypothetical protein
VRHNRDRTWQQKKRRAAAATRRSSSSREEYATKEATKDVFLFFFVFVRFLSPSLLSFLFMFLKFSPIFCF